MYVCTASVHTYTAKRASSPMYGPVQVISPFTNRSKSGGKSEPFRNACKNFLDCAAAAGLSIPLFRRQQKAGSLCFWAQTASLSLSLMLPRRGTLCVRKAGWTPTQPLSAAQRYNTLDFVPKVVCHETPGRFLWILPAQRAGAAGRAAVKIQTGPPTAPRQSTRGSRIFRPSWVSQMRSSSALY